MGTTTRLQLFKDVCAELGSLVTLTASGNGSTTTLVSTANMHFADGALNGYEVWYASGTAANLATTRLVTNTTFSTNTITVSPAWPSASASSDVVLLTNTMGTGVRIAEIHDKIAQLVRSVRSELATEAADTPATFAASDPVLDIPTAWDYFLGIQIEMDPTQVGVWDNLIGEPWVLNTWDSPKTVTIKATHRTLCAGKRLRLIGANDLTEPTTDAATTTVPARWIAKTAAAELLEAVALRSGDVATAFTFGELLKAQSAEMHQYIGKRHRGIGRRIDLRQ